STGGDEDMNQTSEERGQVRHRPDQQNAPGPDTPAQMPAPGWKTALKSALKGAKNDRITLIGAGVAFYWFLAIFPLLIAAVGLLAVVHAIPSFLSGLRGAIDKALPSGGASVLTRALSSAQQHAAGGLTALVAGVAIALYS